MTQNELYAAAAVIAFFAYHVGRGHMVKAKTEMPMPDPLNWLNGYMSA